MKKVVSVICVIALFISIITPTFAVSNPKFEYSDDEIALVEQFNSMEDVSVELKVESGFVVHEISFPTISQLLDSDLSVASLDDADSVIAAQGSDNVQVLKDYINKLDLDEREKASHIKTIEEAITDGYLDGYKIYTTLANGSDYTYYGVYNGYTFYERPSSEVSINYKKETNRNTSELTKWISMAKDLVLTISTPAVEKLNMAVTILNIGRTMFSSNYSAKSGDYAEYYVRTVRRIRHIGFLDRALGGDFRPVLEDSKVDFYPYVVYHFADPSIFNRSAAVGEYFDAWTTRYSEHYRDKEYNMKAAYQQYTNPGTQGQILYMQGVRIENSMFMWEWD